MEPFSPTCPFVLAFSFDLLNEHSHTLAKIRRIAHVLRGEHKERLARRHQSQEPYSLLAQLTGALLFAAVRRDMVVSAR